MAPPTAATALITKANGGVGLLLRQAHLRVIKGPDKGKQVVSERPRFVIGSAEDCDLQLSDPGISRRHLQLLANDRGFVLTDLGSTNGTLLGKVRLGEVVLGDAAAVDLQLGQTTLRIAPKSDTIEIPLSDGSEFHGMIGTSFAMREMFAMLERVAATDSTVLLEGESGTGKEIAARGIHEQSNRATGPFVVVDCAAIPANLIESELFGHERGAFTGADKQRIGAFEQANEGTIFLDEIGELPLELQPRLLRALENQQIKRLGGDAHRQVDVRVIAATNRHLVDEIQHKRFRQDLYYRLSVVRVELPALRQRSEDVVSLARHFAKRFVHDPDQLITEEIGHMLTAHRWPGNIRELRNVVERLAVIPDQTLRNLRNPVSTEPRTNAGVDIGDLVALPFHDARSEWQTLFEKQYLTRHLEQAAGVVSRAAAQADLPRPTFHRLLRQHGLRSPRSAEDDG